MVYLASSVHQLPHMLGGAASLATCTVAVPISGSAAPECGKRQRLGATDINPAAAGLLVCCVPGVAEPQQLRGNAA